MKIACKMCGANLKYVPKTQNAYCEHCGNYFEINEIEFEPKKHDDIDEYTCSSCGAKLIATGKTEIINCLYCGGKEFINAKISNEYIMDGIIPFKLDKAYFIKSYEDYLKTVKDIDLAFYNKLKDARITGFYLPYSFANQFYRKQYPKILNELFEKITPYDFKELKKMNPIYLDAFVAETIKTKKNENDIKTDDVNFFWVPVWIAYLEYKNEKYYIVMNGQTGEMAGVYKDNETEGRKKLKQVINIIRLCILLIIISIPLWGIAFFIQYKSSNFLRWLVLICSFVIWGIICAKNRSNKLTKKEQARIEKAYRTDLEGKCTFTVQKFDIENNNDNTKQI